MKRSLVLFAAFLAFAAPRAAAQCTPGPHSGTITADQTWCAADSPHVVSGVVTVAPGVTLTIEAGSVVKPASITVQGHLVAVGTEASPITFTADGSHWESLRFTGGSGLLRYVDVLKAGWNADGVIVTNVGAPGVSFDRCNLGPGNRGLTIADGVVSITDSKIEAFASGTGTYPIVVSGASSRLTLANDTFLGNWANRVVIGAGAMTGADVTLATQSGLDAYVLGGGYEVPAGRLMTFGAGTTVIPSGRLTVRGQLVTSGTDAAPVVIGSGADWDGILFEGGTGLLSRARLLNAGHNSQGITVRNVAAPGVVLDHASLGQQSRGIAVVDGVLTVRDSSIETTGTGVYAIAVSGPTSLLSVSSTAFSGTDNVARRILIAAGAMTDADFTLAPQTGLEAFQLGNDYTVPAGRTVTVEAGTTVYQDGGLHVQGRLVTNGTADAPITITNGYRWTGVFFDGGTGDLTHTRVTNAGFNTAGITVTNVPTPGVVLDGVTLGPGNGALSITDGVVAVNGSTFTGIGDAYALYVRGASSRLTLSGNTFASNTRNQVHLYRDALTGADFTLVPQSGLDAWHLEGDFAIPAGRTVTIDPGVTVYPDAGLHVLGRLVANGTEDLPVTLTHGWRWNGVFFEGGTGALTWTRVTNAGFNTAALTATNVPLPGVVLDHASIGPGNDGIVSTDSVLVVRDSSFVVNGAGFAIHVHGPTSTLSLASNTFGGATGKARRIGLAAGAMTDRDVTLVPQDGLEAWVLANDYIVPAGRTLTVEAGTPLVPTYPLVVRGRLVTRGAPASPVTIGGYRWGIDVDGGAADLGGAVLRDGGFNYPAVAVRNGGSLLLERTRLHDCNIVRSENSTVTLRNVAFLGGYPGQLEVDLASSATAVHTTFARANGTAVVVANGSTATFTNTIVAACARGVVTDATASATLTNTLWDSVPTRTSGSVTQHGLMVGSAAFEADGFHVGPSSAALAQGVVTNVADDLDGEARPRPAGLLADLGADESDGGTLIPGRTATPIAVGETKNGTAAAGAFADFVVALSPGQVGNLLVRVEAAAGTGAFQLLVRNRQFPLATLFDVEGVVADGTVREALVAAPAPGDWYLGVLSTTGEVPFTITLGGADRGVSVISPASGGNTGRVTVQVAGVGFEDGVRLELRNAGVTLRSAVPATRTSTLLTASLELAGLPPQRCDACVVWPDDESHCLSGGFEIVAGRPPVVNAELSIPGAIRVGRPATGVVTWWNEGNVDVPAPLLVVTSRQGAPLRRNSREGWGNEPIRFLAIDPSSLGSAGTLPPGAHGRATFQVLPEGPAHAPFRLALTRLSDDAMARLIDWAGLEASLRPEGVAASAWARIFPLVRSAVGPTWGDYVARLRSNADDLSAIGRAISDPGALLGVTIDRAVETGPLTSLASAVDAGCPAPGLPLTFGRSLGNGPLARATVGALGVGWTHTYDKRLAVLSNGDREVRSNDGTLRRFRLLPDGTFRGLPGDHGTLLVEGATARLVERFGATLHFDADGRLAAITDGNGNRLDATWDAAGRLVRAVHSNGDRLSFEHAPSGRLVRLVDHAGAVTTYAYDGEDRRLLQVTQPGGRVTRYAYKGTAPDADALVSITFPDGSHVFYDYDSSGRLVGQRRDTGPGTRFQRDARGRLVVGRDAFSGEGLASALAPLESSVLLALDEAGRVGEIVDPLGSSLRFSRDDDGGLTGLLDPEGRSTALEHGPLGEVTALLEEGGVETRQSYGYPPTGGTFARSLTDPLGNRSTFAHDAGGRTTSVTYPGGGQVSLERDERGLVVAYTNRRGQTIRYERNARGQVTRKTLPGGATVEYGYDAAGRLATATDATGTTRLARDARGFLTELSYPDGKWFRYEHDDLGRTTRRTSDDGYVLVWRYDAAGRPVRVERNGGELVVSYAYDSLGRLSREERGNGTATTYTWDAASRVTGVAHLGPGGSTLATYVYAYDAAGRITSATGPDGTATYVWDALGRLASERASNGVLTTYRYDAAGNRVEVETNGVVVPYTVNALNQLTSAGTTTYTWDADGNVASRTTPEGTTTFGWNAEGRLVEVAGAAGNATYAWNALGALEAQTRDGVASHFVNDPVAASGAAATVLDGAGSLAARFDHGASLLAAVDAAGNASSYHFDAMGNTTALTDSAGSPTRTYSYDAHGNVTSTTGTASNPFTTSGSLSAALFAGGFVNEGSTPYDPLSGRWPTTSRDGYSTGANLYTPWKEMKLEPNGPPKTLAGYADAGASWFFWGKGIKGKIWGEPDDLGQFGPDALVEPTYNSVKGILDAKSASEKNDTLSAIEAVGNSALADLELLSVAFPGLRPVAAGTKTIAAVGKKACDLYVANLAPNRDPYWFQPVPRNKWYYYKENFGDVLPPEVLRELLDEKDSDQRTPGDPNEKVATAGLGPRHRIRAGSRIDYVVAFENVPSASAPAQEVFVTDVLDSSLDVSSLELVDAGWASTAVPAPAATQAYRERTVIRDWRPGDLRPWWVDLDARESGPGRLHWTFRTLDPETEDLPEDAMAGFLPPNDATSRGKGWVSFSVRTKTGLAPGTRIANAATIVFDTEAPITSNEVFHTIGLSGDANDDGVVNPADVFYLVAFLYSGGPEPLGVADVNADERVDALDLFYLINYLYAGGPEPQ